MQLIRFLPTVIYLITLFLVVLDTYGSNTKTVRILHIPSYEIALWGIILLSAFRIVIGQAIGSWLTKLNNYCIFPLAMVSSTSLILWEHFSPANYVFSITHLQTSQLLLISVVALCAFLLSKSKRWFAENLHALIFSGAFVFLCYASLVSLLPFSIFERLSHEDGLIESMQFFVLVIGSFFALKTVFSFYKEGIGLHAAAFVLIALAFLFIAGDEISWGQRIFSIATPEMIAKYNRQEEITVHNLSFFDRFVGLGYIIIGIFGTVGWYLLKLFPKLKSFSLRFYIPHWSCSAYFYFGFLYNLFALMHSDHNLGMWSESAELLLYSGLMLTVFFVLKKDNHPIN